MAGKDVLILAAGPWPKGPPPVGLVAQADLIIATDAAWARARARGVRVDWVIGDLDSLEEGEILSLRASGTRTDVYPQDKDRTDLEIAIDEALLTRPERITIYGALGGRTDQTLANVHLLEKLERAGVAGELVSKEERLLVVIGERVLTGVAVGDGVSLLPLSERAEGVTTWGLKYALESGVLERVSSRGVSNEVVSLPVGVRVQTGIVLVVVRPARAVSVRGDLAP